MAGRRCGASRRPTAAASAPWRSSRPAPLLLACSSTAAACSSEYAADLLVALPGQGQVVRVEIISDAAGYHSVVHDFISGLQRPVAVAEGPQGEIYVADAAAGAVYRFWR